MLVVNFLGSGSASLQMRLIDVISGDICRKGNDEPPRGIAVKSALLFVARRWSPEIEVYSIGSKMALDSRRTFSLAVSWRPDDIVASFTDSVVYLLGWMASNLQMVLTLSTDTGRVISRWPVVKMPRRLSVDNGSQDILLACQDGLRLYSNSGLLRYVVPVKVNAGSVWHAVQIPTKASCSLSNRFDVNLCVPLYTLNDAMVVAILVNP